MKRIGIIAAMPGELKPLVRGWRHERRNGVDLWRWRYDEGEWLAACAGAGMDAAARAFAAAESAGPLSFAVSTGWAGALTGECPAGQAFWASGVINAKTGERHRVAHWSGERWLVTSPIVANEAEKHRLAATYGAALVDMEAAAVARLAELRGIPCYCLKGVSDAVDDKLPDFNRFLAPGGQMRLGALIFFALLRPALWPRLVRMGENSRRAARGIAESLLDFLDERAYIRTRNGYPNRKP
ncbi:MAG: nucleoside phosphorylase [Terracidiphilus sp.]